MQELLAYESRDRGTLEPGEELLWEGGAIRAGRPRFRITNRRAFCVDGKDNASKHRLTVRWPFRGMITVGLKRSDIATIRFGDLLWITQVQDWKVAIGYLVQMNRGRLTRRRRGARSTRSEIVMDQSGAMIDYSPLAADLGLLDGERVLWSGRPIVNQPIRWPFIRRKLITLAALIVPSLLAMKVIHSGPLEGSDVIVGAIVVVWFLMALHALTTKPIFARLLLKSTRYVLTTRRAFAIESPAGGRRVRFVFIDALPARFDRDMQRDGSGDVTVGHGLVFKQIADSAAVHQQLVEAVLAARRDLPDLGWQDVPVHGSE